MRPERADAYGVKRHDAATAHPQVDAGDSALGGLARPPAAALPPTEEKLTPWLGAAAIVSLVTLGAVTLGDSQPISVATATLFITLCATLAVVGLVAARSKAGTEASEREERARPAREQLVDIDAEAEADIEQVGSRTYLEGMARWTVALRELIDHAAETTTDDDLRTELTSASEDTNALCSLLRTSTEHELGLNEAATLHSICTMWETDQDRLEQLAADVDPEWHRRWRARSVVERLLRHGPRQRGELVLPYRH